MADHFNELSEDNRRLVDMRLDESIDGEMYQIKVTEANEKRDGFRIVIRKNEVLREVDRYVFESVIERVVVGEKLEDGSVNSYKIN